MSVVKLGESLVIFIVTNIFYNKGILGSKTIISVKVVLNMRKTMMYATLSKLYTMKRYTHLNNSIS